MVSREVVDPPPGPVESEDDEVVEPAVSVVVVESELVSAEPVVDEDDEDDVVDAVVSIVVVESAAVVDDKPVVPSCSSPQAARVTMIVSSSRLDRRSWGSALIAIAGLHPSTIQNKNRFVF